MSEEKDPYVNFIVSFPEEEKVSRYTDYSLIDQLDEDDERLPLYRKQREERGWDDTELWGLDITIIKFAIPRIKRLMEIQHGWPGTEEVPTVEVWEAILREMLVEMEKYAEDMGGDLTLFHKYFGYLWD